jgi:hypothetical protein
MDLICPGLCTYGEILEKTVRFRTPGVSLA